MHDKTMLIAACLLSLSTDAMAMDSRAVALPKAADGRALDGRIELTDGAGGLRVDARIAGLPPGPHAMHIHAGGDCANLAQPGEHFHVEGTHAHGDLPDLVADAAGKATLTAQLPGLTVKDGAGSVAGRTVMIHALGTGAAGHNHVIACAVIARAATPQTTR